MIKFTFDGSEFGLKFFRYPQITLIKGVGYRNQLVTHAQIFTEGILVSEGMAVLYHKDQPNHAIGRRFALVNALTPFDRDFRLAVWNAYNSRNKNTLS